MSSFLQLFLYQNVRWWLPQLQSLFSSFDYVSEYWKIFETFLIFNNPCNTYLVEPSLIVWTRIMLSIFWSICSILYFSLCYVKYCVTQDLVHCLTHAYEPDKILLLKGWWHQIACIFLLNILYNLKLYNSQRSTRQNI